LMCGLAEGVAAIADCSSCLFQVGAQPIAVLFCRCWRAAAHTAACLETFRRSCARTFQWLGLWSCRPCRRPSRLPQPQLQRRAVEAQCRGLATAWWRGGSQRCRQRCCRNDAEYGYPDTSLGAQTVAEALPEIGELWRLHCLAAQGPWASAALQDGSCNAVGP